MEYEQQFERDFTRRTLDLVKQYKGPYDATLLLNCLLGLLIVPKEASLNRIPRDPLASLHNWGISSSSITSPGTSPDAHNLQGLVRSLRNAVAHFRFRPLHKDGKVIAFQFDDRSGFAATIVLDEMRVFVERLAAHLEEVNQG